MPTQHFLLGAGLIIASELMFVSMGAMVKVATADLPSAQVVFFRNLVGLLLLSPLILRYGIRHIATNKLRFHLLRSLAGLSAMYCYFYSIAHIPLAEAALFKMTAPFFMPVIALFWLHESIPDNVRWAVGIGFLGIVCILKPGFQSFSWVMLVALSVGLFSALAKVTIRRLSVGTEPFTRTVFYFSAISTLVSFGPAVWQWVPPDQSLWLALFALGVFGTIGQLFMSYAFSLAPAGSLGPFTYISVVFASAYGWLFWDETLDILTFLGAAFIIGAGWLASRKPRPRAETLALEE